MSNQIGPIELAEDVTGGDTYDEQRGLYVGGTGDVVITQPSGNNTTYTALAAGVWHPICSIGIVATGTTATNIKVGN
jgi:hypothetical protein